MRPIYCIVQSWSTLVNSLLRMVTFCLNFLMHSLVHKIPQLHAPLPSHVNNILQHHEPTPTSAKRPSAPRTQPLEFMTTSKAWGMPNRVSYRAKSSDCHHEDEASKRSSPLYRTAPACFTCKNKLAHLCLNGRVVHDDGPERLFPIGVLHHRPSGFGLREHLTPRGHVIAETRPDRRYGHVPKTLVLKPRRYVLPDLRGRISTAIAQATESWHIGPEAGRPRRLRSRAQLAEGLPLVPIIKGELKASFLIHDPCGLLPAGTTPSQEEHKKNAFTCARRLSISW